MNRKKIMLSLVASLLALLAAVCAIVFFSLAGSLESQKAAQRWKGESELRFAQVSAFFPIGSEQSADTLRSFHDGFSARFRDAGLEEPETGSLWHDGWSAKCKLTVSGSRGSSQATAMAVAGDFFFFHPLRLRSGGYISGDDLMQDRVVLDEELAWRLFGGVDLAGMTVTIDGNEYLVAGVIARETDAASRRAYTDGPGLFMSYETALKDERISGISCYELVMANPVTGFARDIVSTAMSGGGANPIVENSSRFSIGSIFGVLGDFTARSMDSYGVAYPYWENAARMTETKLAICLLLFLIFILFPLGCFCVLLFRLLKAGGRLAKSSAIRLKDGISDRIYYARSKKQEEAVPPLTRREKKKLAKAQAKAEAEAEAEDVPEAQEETEVKAAELDDETATAAETIANGEANDLETEAAAKTTAEAETEKALSSSK